MATNRIQVASDDGHSCTLVLIGTATILKVIEEYCRLRKISDPVGSADVAPADCILTRHLSDSNTELEYLSNDVKLNAVLSSKGARAEADGIAAKFGLIGYATKNSLSAIAKIDAFAGQLASLSASFSTALADVNGTLRGGSSKNSELSLDAIALKVHGLEQAFKNDVLLTLAQGSKKDRSILDSARGNLLMLYNCVNPRYIF